MEFDIESDFNKRYGLVTRQILRLLSENSRISVTEIAKRLKISRRNAAQRIKKIEKEFGIEYTLELSAGRLGLETPYIILVKFGKRPDYREIAELLQSSPIPQLAFETKGLYDMFIYATSRSRARYAKWDREVRRALAAKYKMQWRQSYISFRRIGFFPLRNEAIDDCRVAERDKAMLKILNDNSRISLKELAKKLGINYKTAVYDFKVLVKKQYIKRFTVVMKKPKDVALVGFFSRYMPPQNMKSARIMIKDFLTSDDGHPLISRILLRVALIGAYDSYTLCVFDNFSRGFETIKLFRKLLDKIAPFSVSHAQVTNTLLGKLPIRSVDLKNEFKEHMVKKN